MDSFGYFGGPDLIFSFAPLIFIIVFGIIIVNLVKGVSEWSSNNKQPVLDVNCKVISKRMNVSHSAGHHDANGHYVGGGSSTHYYVTFEFESKDRMEFKVSGSQYGMLLEGDYGKLKFQGTRYLDFTRQ